MRIMRKLGGLLFFIICVLPVWIPPLTIMIMGIDLSYQAVYNENGELAILRYMDWIGHIARKIGGVE